MYPNIRTHLICFISAVALAFSPTITHAQDLDVPYVPTPQPVVDRMLEIAEVEPGDYVIDLGSGDGRIIISAVELGATGHGVDLDPERVMEAQQNAEDAEVTDRLMFLREDIFETDFSGASVITMYLLPSVNLKLRPKLLDELEPGTRIVSHSFDMDDWEPDHHEVVDNEDSLDPEIYFWIIPADAEGSWNWEADGQPYEMAVTQDYQEIEVELTSNGESLEIEDPVLKGKRISFLADNGEQHFVFSGRIEDDSLNGTIQIHEDDQQRQFQWSASRSGE